MLKFLYSLSFFVMLRKETLKFVCIFLLFKPRNLRPFLTQPRKPKIQLKEVLNLEIITTNMQYLIVYNLKCKWTTEQTIT